MQLVKVSELIPHSRNNEFFDDVTGKRWDEFLESVKTSGVIEPIVITEGKVIVSGHQRVRACKELGISEIMAEIKLYEGDEKKIVKDLIETNVRQRGTIGGSDQQIVARVEALKDWYGVHNGNNQHTKEGSANGETLNGESEPSKMEDILKILGLSRKQYDTAKKITDKTIPEVQQLIDKGTVSRRTVADLITKLSEEDQKKLVDSLPEDVKLTAKSVDEYIQKLREGLVANTNKAMEENSRLMGENDKLSRENETLRAGGASPEVQEKLKQLEDERQELEWKLQSSKKDNDSLRKSLENYYNRVTELEDTMNGGDSEAIQLQIQVDELRKKLEAKEREANDLEYQLGEKDDEINALKRSRVKGGVLGQINALNSEEDSSRRKIDAFRTDVQYAISNATTMSNEMLMKSDMFEILGSNVLTSLAELASQAISSMTSLREALIAANPDSQDNTNHSSGLSNYDPVKDYDLDDSGLDAYRIEKETEAERIA